MQNPVFKEDIKNDYRISHSITDKWVMTSSHFHDVYEIYLAISNTKYLVNDNIYYLKKGDLLVLNSRDLHRSIPQNPKCYERYVITFKPEYIRDMNTSDTNLLDCFENRNPDCPCVHLNTKQFDRFTDLVEKGMKIFDSSIYGKELYVKMNLVEILLAVNAFFDENKDMLNHTYNSESYERIRPVVQYIHENLGSGLSLSGIASTFYISQYHLNTLFRKETGFTVKDYIIRNRILKSRELLKKGLPVCQVCEKVGYGSVCNYIRMFKKLTGTTPGKYSRSQIF